MNAATLESAIPGEDAKREENILLFQERQIRHDFMRKVFSIVITQIFITCLIIAPMILHQPTREMLIKDRGIFYGSSLFFMAVYLAIVCCNGLTRSFPLNYLILLMLTIAMSVWAGCICALFDQTKVLLAIGICLVLCSALYLFAIQTAIDFTAAMGIMFIFCIAFLILIILSMFFPSDALTWIILIGMTVTLCIYFIIDIQMMMGGNHKFSLAPEDYILAATLLYVDIIYLFIYILMILGKSDN